MTATAHKVWIGVRLSPPKWAVSIPSMSLAFMCTRIFSSPSGDPTELEALSEEEKKHWQSFLWWIENKGAYNPLQSTVPQTLAHALADSPVGQLAWNYQIYGGDVHEDYH